MESHLIIVNLETIPIGRQATNKSKSQVHEEAQAVNQPPNSPASVDHISFWNEAHGGKNVVVISVLNSEIPFCILVR
jgi:hypothetical protein